MRVSAQNFSGGKKGNKNIVDFFLFLEGGAKNQPIGNVKPLCVVTYDEVGRYVGFWNEELIILAVNISKNWKITQYQTAIDNKILKKYIFI